MALPVTIPNEFANATASIPLSQLDTNFTTLANAVNGISDGSETLANVTATVVNATTVDTTNIEVTNIKAKDGTAAVVITDSTGAVAVSTALTANGGVVFNDAGADVDFRVEGDTDANLLFVDASTDRVGIGTNTPDALLNVDGIASFGAGAAATPSIAAAGDLNTGIFFPAADTIAFAEGGAEAMRIDSSGNVGIGTSSPDELLQVESMRFNGGNGYGQAKTVSLATTTKATELTLFTFSSTGTSSGSGNRATLSFTLNIVFNANTSGGNSAHYSYVVEGLLSKQGAGNIALSLGTPRELAVYSSFGTITSTVTLQSASQTSALLSLNYSTSATISTAQISAQITSIGCVNGLHGQLIIS